MTPQNAASHLGLFCLLREFSSKIKQNLKITTDAPKNESGLTQMIVMGKSISQIWVKKLDFEALDLLSICLKGNKFSQALGSASLKYYMGN